MIFELAKAQKEVYRICQKGQTVSLTTPSNPDEFGEPQATSTINLKCFPVRYSPFNRKTVGQISWADEVDVLIFVSKKAFDDAGYDILKFKNIYKRFTVTAKEYDIRYIDNYMAHGPDFLYVVIGGKK